LTRCAATDDLNYAPLPPNRNTPLQTSPPAVNERRRTHEGIDTCGDRLAQLILGRTAQLKLDGHRVAKVSLIGYSLGGLMCR
jgi:hypothetical protein